MIKSAVSSGYGHIFEEILNGKLHFLHIVNLCLEKTLSANYYISSRLLQNNNDTVKIIKQSLAKHLDQLLKRTVSQIAVTL